MKREQQEIEDSRRRDASISNVNITVNPFANKIMQTYKETRGRNALVREKRLRSDVNSTHSAVAIASYIGEHRQRRAIR